MVGRGRGGCSHFFVETRSHLITLSETHIHCSPLQSTNEIIAGTFNMMRRDRSLCELNKFAKQQLVTPRPLGTDHVKLVV